MLNFELQLNERQADRVLVSVYLDPQGDPCDVDGVALMLVSAAGEALSSRLMLPIAGSLQQPVLTTIELRATRPLLTGARIQGVAWHGQQQWEATIPADPGTQLEGHVRGRLVWCPPSDDALQLRGLTEGEWERLHLALPWLTDAPAPPPTVFEPDPNDDLRAACADLGLDDDDADWLEDLLNEP